MIMPAFKMDLLESGIFTASEAAMLVGTTERKIRGWISGYKGREDPILDNDLGWLGGKLAFSFTNLMEMRFVAFFVDAGVPLKAIRAIMHEAKQALRHPHPFATRTVFRTDGKKIVAEIGRTNGLPDIYDLRSKNYEMSVVVLDSLKAGVEFDPAGDAVQWSPRPDIAPNVIIHPKLSFGQPVLRKSRIPIATIVDAVNAEGSIRSASSLFDVPERQVKEAVTFFNQLRRAA